MWDVFRTLIDEAGNTTEPAITNATDGPRIDMPIEAEDTNVFLAARFFQDLADRAIAPPAPSSDGDTMAVALVETPPATNALTKRSDRQTVGDRKPEVLCEDWLKLNWAFDENTPPVVFPTACINDPNTFTPQLRFDPRWHLVRPGAIALEQNPYEQVETFHPVTWGMPAHTVNTD